MHSNDTELRDALQAAEMNVSPDPEHVGAVQTRMATLARSGIGDRHRVRNAWIVGLLLCGIGGAALGATATGRGLLRWIFTPVLPRHEVTVTTPDGSTWSRAGSTRPYGPESRQVVADQFTEIAALAQAGRGALVGLRELPDSTIYSIRYSLKDGSSAIVATGVPTELQALNLGIDEIQRSRDAGAGRVIAQSPSPHGLGAYLIRFALPGRTVDLETWYPPGPRADRDAIFAETRKLKADLLFTVEEAEISVDHPGEGVRGRLRYTLADGRTVGIVEQVPDELITPDGAYVIGPGVDETVAIAPGGFWTAPDGDLYLSLGGDDPESPENLDRFRELHAIKEAGGGRLVGLVERPGWAGELSTTSFQVEYTLGDGGTTRVGEGDLSIRQKADMRVDEIRRLRDIGAGEIIAQRESPLGMGGFTIRFTLAGGETVDLRTMYPPCTRQQREAIFAETRELKAQRKFEVREPQVLPGAGVGGILVFVLSDGRSVSHYEQVPTDLITSDGTHIVTPATGALVEIEDQPGD
ncbi:MAG: hypothetical protein ACYSU7_07295 [Planctomycetota bacterium]|jgi:hypothetical protein